MVSEHPIHPSLSTMTKPTNPPKGDTSKQSHSTSSSLVEVIVEPSTSQSPTEQMLSALQCQLQQLSADMATRLSASEQKVLHQVNEVTNRIHKLETQKAIAGNLPPLGFTCSTSLADTFPSLQQLQAPPPLSTVPPVLPHHIDNTSYFGTPPMTAFHPGTMGYNWRPNNIPAPQDHRPRPHLFNNRLFEWPDRRPDDYDRNRRVKMPFIRNTFPVELDYQSGFGNHFSSEAIQGALPRGQNSPLECPYSLYTEQISGTSFTVPRKLNQCSWLYRVKPSVTHEPFSPRIPAHGKLVSEFNESNSSATPTQLRWKPMEVPESPTDFIDGLFTVCGAGSSYLRHGFAIHMYSANKSMEDCAFCSADGDFLVVPQDGRLWITTECGRLQVSPGEIVILPQGFRFAIDLPDGPSKGYVAETFGTHFQLPDLGPIGANGLAASRDFVAPVAWFEHVACPGYTIVQKFGGELFTAKQDFSPFNVVAWHGNYVPYKYDLSKFCPYNTVLFDHSDPSVNTVLTAPTDRPGLALLDFVIFPPRWVVAEHTFRPPYYHRNCMSEFMGLIYGGYEAKADGFLPGGASLHSCMSPHGPDTTTYEATIATGNELVPKRLSNTMAFMFETCLIPRICPWALQSPTMDHDYYRCWIDLKSHFTGEQTQAAQNDAKLKE